VLQQIGARIYYDIETGEVILNTGERAGHVVELTPEQERERYTALAERVESSYSWIDLEYGQYREDFAICSGYRVNPETKTLEFSYPDPNEPETPPVYHKPLTEQVAELQDENAFLTLELATTQARLDQTEQEQADLLLMLVAQGVI